MADENFKVQKKQAFALTAEQKEAQSNALLKNQRSLDGQGYSEEELLNENEKIRLQLGSQDVWNNVDEQFREREKRKLKSRSLRNSTILLFADDQDETQEQKVRNGNLSEIKNELANLDKKIRVPFKEENKAQTLEETNAAYENTLAALNRYITGNTRPRFPEAKERLAKVKAFRDALREEYEQSVSPQIARYAHEQIPESIKSPMDFLEGRFIQPELNDKSAEFVSEKRRELLGVRRKGNKSDSSEMRNVKRKFKELTAYLSNAIAQDDEQFESQKQALTQKYNELALKCDAYLRRHKKPKKDEEKERVAAVKELKEHSAREAKRIMEVAGIMRAHDNERINGLTWADAYAYTYRELDRGKDALANMELLIDSHDRPQKILTMFSAIETVISTDQENLRFLSDEVRAEWIKKHLTQRDVIDISRKYVEVITKLAKAFNEIVDNPVPMKALKNPKTDNPMDQELREAYARLVIMTNPEFQNYKTLRNFVFFVESGIDKQETDFKDDDQTAGEYYQEQIQTYRDAGGEAFKNAELIAALVYENGGEEPLLNGEYINQVKADSDLMEIAQSKEIVKALTGEKVIGYRKDAIKEARDEIKETEEDVYQTQVREVFDQVAKLKESGKGSDFDGIDVPVNMEALFDEKTRMRVEEEITTILTEDDDHLQASMKVKEQTIEGQKTYLKFLNDDLKALDEQAVEEKNNKKVLIDNTKANMGKSVQEMQQKILKLYMLVYKKYCAQTRKERDEAIDQIDRFYEEYTGKKREKKKQAKGKTTIVNEDAVFEYKDAPADEEAGLTQEHPEKIRHCYAKLKNLKTFQVPRKPVVSRKMDEAGIAQRKAASKAYKDELVKNGLIFTQAYNETIFAINEYLETHKDDQAMIALRNNLKKEVSGFADIMSAHLGFEKNISKDTTWGDVVKKGAIKSRYSITNQKNLGGGSSDVYKVKLKNLYFKPEEKLEKSETATFSAIAGQYIDQIGKIKQKGISAQDKAVMVNIINLLNEAMENDYKNFKPEFLFEFYLAGWDFKRTKDARANSVEFFKALNTQPKTNSVSEKKLTEKLNILSQISGKEEMPEASNILFALRSTKELSPAALTMIRELTAKMMTDFSVKLNAFSMATKEAKIPAGSSMSDRNVATTRLANLLGIGHLVAHSETAYVQKGNEEIRGNVMEEAKGERIPEIKNKHVYSEQAILDINTMGIFDLLFGQIDRHYENFRYVTHKEGNQEVIDSVLMIDNDMGGGALTVEDIKKGVNAQQPYRFSMMIALPDAVHEKIRNLDMKTVELVLGDILSKSELDAMGKRLEFFQGELKRYENWIEKMMQQKDEKHRLTAYMMKHDEKFRSNYFMRLQVGGQDSDLLRQTEEKKQAGQDTFWQTSVAGMKTKEELEDILDDMATQNMEAFREYDKEHYKGK